MCGIIGSISDSQLSDKLINKLQKHKNIEDHIGKYKDISSSKKIVTLLHQRFSIIDLSDDHQPMFDNNKDIIIVFNREVFNHIQLKKN